MPDFVSGEWGLTAILSAVSLAAVWVPFQRGLRVGLQALSATRRVEGAELKRMAREGCQARIEPLALVMVKVLAKALRESRSETAPREFVVDATRQYVTHEYDAHYAQPISMYANILPPIGFIGTTAGLLVLFATMHLNDSTVELGALALALVSSILALVGFAILEGLKIRLYQRMLASVGHVVELQRSAEGRAGAAAPAPQAGR